MEYPTPTPRPRRKSAIQDTARRKAFVYDAQLYTPDSAGSGLTHKTKVPLIQRRRDWLGPCNVLRPSRSSHHRQAYLVEEASASKSALDIALTHLAAAAARLSRCGPAFSTACERLWYFAAGSWEWGRWQAAMKNLTEVERGEGLAVQLSRARRECERALEVLEVDGEDGEFERDAEDLREILGEFGIGMEELKHAREACAENDFLECVHGDEVVLPSWQDMTESA